MFLAVGRVNATSILNPEYTFGYDQAIITRVILENDLCDLPATHQNWKRVGLKWSKGNHLG